MAWPPVLRQLLSGRQRREGWFLSSRGRGCWFPDARFRHGHLRRTARYRASRCLPSQACHPGRSFHEQGRLGSSTLWEPIVSPARHPAEIQTLLAQACDEGALADAWARVHANAGCPGVDGVSVDQYHHDALSRLAALRAEVAAGRYRPQPLLSVDIPKPSGRLRSLAIPTVSDRVLQTAVAQLLTRLLDPDFDDASFAYRSGRSVQQATARIVDCRDQGLRWVVDADIERYFDSIHHATLLSMLRRRLPDDSLTALLAQWLAAPASKDKILHPRRSGVPQGSPISPLLSNLYLHTLDNGKRPRIAVLQVIQQSGLISSVNSPSSHARAMAASRRVRSW